MQEFVREGVSNNFVYLRSYVDFVDPGTSETIYPLNLMKGDPLVHPLLVALKDQPWSLLVQPLRPRGNMVVSILFCEIS